MPESARLPKSAQFYLVFPPWTKELFAGLDGPPVNDSRPRWAKCLERPAQIGQPRRRAPLEASAVAGSSCLPAFCRQRTPSPEKGRWPCSLISEPSLQAGRCKGLGKLADDFCASREGIAARGLDPKPVKKRFLRADGFLPMTLSPRLLIRTRARWPREPKGVRAFRSGPFFAAVNHHAEAKENAASAGSAGRPIFALPHVQPGLRPESLVSQACSCRAGDSRWPRRSSLRSA